MDYGLGGLNNREIFRGLFWLVLFVVAVVGSGEVSSVVVPTH